MTARLIGIVAGSAAVVALLANFPAAAQAENHISVGAAGTTIEVNGASIPTSELTLAELGALQGVPPSSVNAEFEGVAAGTPAAAAIDAVVSKFTGMTPLATALSDVAGASGGTLTSRSTLARIVGGSGQPGAAGSNGSPGASGSAGGGGSPGASANANAPSSGSPSSAGAPAHGKLVLRALSRSVRGGPRSHVRLRFSVSSAARIIYGGRNLATGYRVVHPGTNVIVITLPSKSGTYHVTLLALAISEVRSAQTTIALKDLRSKRHH